MEAQMCQDMHASLRLQEQQGSLDSRDKQLQVGGNML
jgi:hypothetical protein